MCLLTSMVAKCVLFLLVSSLLSFLSESQFCEHAQTKLGKCIPSNEDAQSTHNTNTRFAASISDNLSGPRSQLEILTEENLVDQTLLTLSFPERS